MNKDFRISISFLDHIKTIKLQRKLKDKGVIALMRLWSFVAQHRPSGILKNMDEEDISIAAKWSGDQDLFVNTLVELKFLDIIFEEISENSEKKYFLYIIGKNGKDTFFTLKTVLKKRQKQNGINQKNKSLILL